MEATSARPTFLQHYINYLSSDAGLIAIFVLFALILYAWTESQRPAEVPLNIPGCVRFGLYNRSNLDTQYDSKDCASEEDQEPRVQALFAYPIKSCRGVELAGAEVTGLGLKHDRLFTFAQLVKKATDSKSGLGEKGSTTHQWRFITQRERPQMALITTELWIPDPRLKTNAPDEVSDSGACAVDQVNDWTANGGCLIVRFPHARSFLGYHLYTETISIKLPLSPTPQRAQAKRYTLEPLSIWKDSPLALNINSEIDQASHNKLKAFLGISNPLALFRVDSTNNLRTILRSLPKDHPNETYQVGFGDAFPLSLLNLASVRSVDASLPDSSKLKNNLDALRFRANIYITGPPAFAEDSWKRVLMGLGQGPEVDSEIELGEYHIACRTARCTLPNVDPSTGMRDKSEPFATLKRTRVVDEGAKPHSSLGMSVLPLFSKGIIRVGDGIEVEEVGEHVYEKMFK